MKKALRNQYENGGVHTALSSEFHGFSEIARADLRSADLGRLATDLMNGWGAEVLRIEVGLPSLPAAPGRGVPQCAPAPRNVQQESYASCFALMSPG